MWKALFVAAWLVFVIGCNSACDTCCKVKPPVAASNIFDTIAAAKRLDTWVKAKPNREVVVTIRDGKYEVRLVDGVTIFGRGADLAEAVKDAFKE